MKKIKFDKYLFICIILTIVGYGILFYVNNIYPFGTKIINLLDFDGGYIPAYYKLWDVLHFESTALFDWNLGSGLNAFGSLIGNGFISPLCWIIALFSRSSIPYTISYVYLLKIVFISLMTYIAIGKIFPKTEGPYKVIFTMLYTFSCFLFIMSTNLLYLDAIAIFPLFVYSLKELLEKGHWKLYTVLLTLTLLMSYYIAWLDLLFIISISGFALIFMKTDHKKEKAVKVLVCTLFSLLMSCVLFLPGFMFARSSARMANNFSNDGIFAYFIEKSSYLFTLAIPFVLTIKQLFVKKDKKLNRFIIAMLCILLLGVFIEPINALWHTGSHSGFPLRYGYQIIFFTILTSIYYLNNNYKPLKNTNYLKVLVPVFLMINIIITFFVTRKDLFGGNFYAGGNIQIPCYITLLFIFAIYIITYILILKNDKKKALIMTIALVVIQSLNFGYLYLQFLPIETSVSMENLAKRFELVNDDYNYSLDLESTNINFPYILKVPSMENRIHFIEQSEIDQRNYFGFGGDDTFIESKGGNIFTNALMQNKYFITTNKLNDKYYDFISSYKDINYYKAKYNLKYLIPYNGKEYNEPEEDMFINANKIYKSLFDGKKDLFEKVNYKLDSKYLYFNAKKGKTYVALVIFDKEQITDKVNKGEEFNLDFKYDDKEISYYNETTIKSYRLIVSFESNVDKEIKIGLTDINMEYSLYEFDDTEYKKFIDTYGNEDVSIEVNGTTKTYNYNSTKDTSVLLPINCTSNYEVRINGEKVDYKCNLYNMLSVETKKGNNKIEVEYKQKWFKIGTLISIVSLIVLVILNLLNKKIHFMKSKIVVYPLFIVSLLAFAFFIIKIYILSLF